EGRTEASDQVTRHGAKPFISMGAPSAFLLHHLVPRPHERLDGPMPIRQGGSGAAYGVCGQSSVGQCREDGPPTAQESAREKRPEQPDQPQMRTDRHVNQYCTKQDRNTVDYGRHGASLREYSVATLLYLKTCLMWASPPQFTGN